ncbi:hypothetical protein GN109_05785 [Collimonas pratensis]|uniref:hypothetical protein n=1 Tax=Collimonas pratensis TaxID=279113 RepID=UPI00143D8F1A|nr:hypothetical protein [Collimonas pratensis]NKI68925.1 hypothetical protein [Collimonas pratensis]
MLTNVAASSIECFHGRVQSRKGNQYLRILHAMELGRSYTGQQLCAMTGLTPNAISGRLFELRESGEVVREAERQVCPISHVLVYTHKKLPKQMELV